MCDSFQLHSNESIEVQRRSSELQIEEHPHGMCQYLTDETMLEVPQIMDTNAGDSKTFGQVGPHGFHALTQPCTELEQRRRVRGYHTFARWCHHHDSVSLGQQRVAVGVNKES